MRTKISPELVEKYLRNECSFEEKKLVHDWYASFENEPDPVESDTPESQKALKERMLSRIRITLKYDPPSEKKDRVFPFWRFYYSPVLIAASVVIVFSAVYFLSGLNSLRVARPSLPDVVSYTNSEGSLKKCVLPDGSIAWLKPSTTVTYLKSRSADREVNLSGECFFEVRHDSRRPFIIHTGKLSTRVLGTSFNVKAYQNFSSAEVSVVSGKVYVFTTGSSPDRSKGIILLPKQKGIYSAASNSILQARESGPDLRIWEKKSVSFENESMAQVIKVLNHNFKVDISIDDPLINSYILKADFTNQSLPVILEMISKSLDVNYQISGDRILIINNQY